MTINFAISLAPSERNIISLALCILLAISLQVTEASAPAELHFDASNSNCNIFKDVGANDLSINDIVVKNSDGDVACIKARFSLAIKVEAATGNSMPNESSIDQKLDAQTNGNHKTSSNQTEARMLLGYLPLDSVLSVQDTCPDPKPSSQSQNDGSDKGGRSILKGYPELEMIVQFECGKFAFKFTRDDKYYVSAIRGVVSLDSSTVKPFTAEKNMFLTSDLSHHFKFNDLIEVSSSTESKAFILTANFYNLEFETFRNTTSRSFIRPPDSESRPFPE